MGAFGYLRSSAKGILKEQSKTEVARVIPFEAGSRLEKLLRRRAFLGPDAYVFGEATTGAYVASLKSAWATLPCRPTASHRHAPAAANACRIEAALAKIDLHWHELRHEALSRLADDGVPIQAAVAGRTRQHHDHPTLHDGTLELARGIDAARARTSSKRLEQSDDVSFEMG